MNESLEIGRLSGDDSLQEFAHSMTEAFRAYPVMVRAFVDAPGDREVWIRRMITDSARARMASGVPIPVALLSGHVIGGAFLFLPDVKVPEDFAVWWPRLLEEAGPTTSNYFERFIAAAESVELPQPHVYLAMIGVHPDFQGTGVGKALVEHVLEMARQMPGVVGVGLDTELPENVAIYERWGFTTRGTASVDDMPVWVMFREM